MSWRINAIGTIFFLLAPGFAPGADIYVPDHFSTIQGAINASVDGDSVIVRPGTYLENIDFIGKAITVKSERGAEFTVIDGGNPANPDEASVVYFRSCEDRDAVLSGFTITNGTGTSPAPYDNYGGGIYCMGSSPTITNNIISGNSAWVGSGGGIYCDTSSPIIENNTICNNSAELEGGGIFADPSSFVLILNNTIENNYVECVDWISWSFGGGICCSEGQVLNNLIRNNNTYSAFSLGGGICCFDGDVLVSDNIITGNFASTGSKELARGGGIHCGVGSTITGNIITGNTATKRGGGIFCEGSSTITGNTITGNKCYVDGGGIHCRGFSPTITNNNISGNMANYGNGGGIYLESSSSQNIANNNISENSADYGGGIFCYVSSPVITNSTITENTASNGGGICCSRSSSLTLSNAILWDNTAGMGEEIFLKYDSLGSSTLFISYSDVEGGQSLVYVDPSCTLNWGLGMIDADPLFCDPDNDDFHLTWDSPCRNTGDNSAVTVLHDFEGDPRIHDSTVDMGADEFHLHLYEIGAVIPGSSIDLKVAGPPSSRAWLLLGSGIQDPPQPTWFGDLYLKLPILERWQLGLIPDDGILALPVVVPSGSSAGELFPLQALVYTDRTRLSNLMALTVE